MPDPLDLTLDQEMDRLRRLPVFACLDAEALKLLAFSADAWRLPAGHVLFRRGETAESAVLVASGTVALDAEHEDELSIRWAEAGTLLNEAALFAPTEQVVTATAHEDCLLVAVTHRLMMRMLEAHPSNAVALRRYWAGRLRERIAGLTA